MKEASDDDGFESNLIANDVSAPAEPHLNLAISRARARRAAVGEIRERANRSINQVHGADRGPAVARCKKIDKPSDVAPCPLG
jgi:hypothetical protein